MKNPILCFAVLMLSIGSLLAQGNKVKLTFDYGRSRSLLKLDSGNEESDNSTFQLGASYRVGERWNLNLGLRHMLTSYNTEFSQRKVHDNPTGGVTTSTSALTYRNLGFPIGVGYEPLKHLVFQISLIPTHNSTAYTSQHSDYYDESNFTIETASGMPKQFAIFWGSSIEYAIGISKRVEIRFGARATTSRSGLLKDEDKLTRLVDFGVFVGAGFRL